MALVRKAFSMGFNSHNLRGYLADHAAVWPSMQEALVATGWLNYSLFAAADGLAIGCFDSPVSFTEACARMDALPHKIVNQEWQAAMAGYTPLNSSPIDSATELTSHFRIGEVAAPDVLWTAQQSTAPPPLTSRGLSRTCLVRREVDAAALKDYAACAEEGLPPSVLAALESSGVRSYSVFSRPADGLVAGIVELDNDGMDLAARHAKITTSADVEPSRYWNIDPLCGHNNPGEMLAHYFYLGTDVGPIP